MRELVISLCEPNGLLIHNFPEANIWTATTPDRS